MVKIVYILVSSQQDFFLEQTILSAYSAKRYNPNVNIVVVADQDTAKTLIGSRRKINEYVTTILIVDVPVEYNMMQKSRFLKTNLPAYVDGDFIYMDSDTVVSGSLEEAYDGVKDLGLVRDENLSDYSSYIKGWIRGNCEKMGWSDLSEEKGYNGGVIVYKDSPMARLFFARWHENWKECCGKGYDRDQLALMKANKDAGNIFTELDGKYNCQISKFESDKYKSDARILHYYDISNCYHIYNDLKVWNKFKNLDVIPQEFLYAVDNPQKVLSERYIRVYENDIKFLHSSWHEIYFNYPALQKIFLPFCLALCRVWEEARNVKYKLLR